MKLYAYLLVALSVLCFYPLAGSLASNTKKRIDKEQAQSRLIDLAKQLEQGTIFLSDGRNTAVEQELTELIAALSLNASQKDQIRNTFTELLHQARAQQVHESTIRKMLDAVRDNDQARMAELLKDLPVDSQDRNGMTALMVASDYGYIELVKLLLSTYQATPDIKNRVGETALLIATSEGNSEIVRLLLEYKANPDSATNAGVTPLLLGVKNKNKDIIKQLLTYKANSCVMSKSGETPLSVAKNDQEMLQVFSHAGILHKFDDLTTPLFEKILEYIIIDKRNFSQSIACARQLGTLNKKCQQSVQDIIYRHFKKSGITKQIIEKLICNSSRTSTAEVSNELPQELINSHASSTLHYAARYNHHQLIQSLLSGHAKPLLEIQDNSGATPLLTAVIYNAPQAAKVLIEAGANINAQDSQGDTVLHRAARNKWSDAIIVLYKSRSQLEIKNKKGLTPLLEALIAKGKKSAKQLVEYGANVNVKTPDGNSCLMLSTYLQDIDNVKTLLNARANLTDTGKDEQTPLHQAVKKGHTEIIKLLLQAGEQEYTLGLSKTIESLPESPIKKIILFYQHKGPELLKAIESDNARQMQLLGEPSNYDIADESGNNPLHWALIYKKYNLAKIIIAHHSDLLDKPNNNNITPLNLALSDRLFGPFIMQLIK